MSEQANPGRFAKMEVYLDGEWLNVGGIVDIERSREISQIEITDHDSPDGEQEFLPNLSNTTYSFSGRFKSGNRGQQAILNIADTKTRLNSRFYMKKDHGSNEPYWEGKVSVTSEGTSGPMDAAGEISVALQGSIIRRYFQDSL